MLRWAAREVAPGAPERDRESRWDDSVWRSLARHGAYGTTPPGPGAAASRVDRLYHSVALLVPDGKVVTAGSNPARKDEELRIEVFWPPYLFRGSRPKIRKAPKVLLHDHLDGGLRPETIVDLARESGYDRLPSTDPKEPRP